MEAIIEFISEMQEDSSTPKNVRARLATVTNILKDDSEPSIKVNKALDELDDLSSDNNIQQYTRTQIWNVVSLLERI